MFVRSVLLYFLIQYVFSALKTRFQCRMELKCFYYEPWRYFRSYAGRAVLTLHWFPLYLKGLYLLEGAFLVLAIQGKSALT